MVFLKKNASSFFYNIRKIWNPAVFHGNGKTKNYFEGWYFKLVSKDGKDKLAFIPGIALGRAEDAHAFVQFIDGTKGTSEYFRFDIADFTYSAQTFEVSIGNNFFSAQRIELDLQN